MHPRLRQYSLIIAICVLTLMFVVTPVGVAQSHVVTPTDIHKELVNATRSRQKNLEKAESLFSSESTQKALKSVKADPEQVKAAISTLTDAELAQLASRADRLQNDFAAGRISERDLLIIILAVAALILIIVAVR